MYDFIIVGGGIAGLELGAMLSYDGYKVLILERAEHIGGRAFIHSKDGFELDNGIHLVRFGRKSAIANVLRHIHRDIVFRSLGKSYFIDNNNTFILFPTGPSGFLKSKLFTFSERLKALKIMIGIKGDKAEKFSRYTVEEWMHISGVTGGLRDYFNLVCASMLVCPLPSIASAMALIENINMVLKTGISVEYPSHGWQRDIILPLVETVKKNGEIKTGTMVDSVVLEHGKATGVKVKGEFIPANNVIIDVPSQDIGQLLDINSIPDERIKTAVKLVPTSGISIDYAIDGHISDMDGLLYFADPVSFGCFISNLSRDVVPSGKSLLTWFCPINNEDMKQPNKVKGYEQRLQERIERLFPMLKEKTLFKRILHFDRVDGVELNINQLREKRIDYSVKGIDNLYFVGDTTAAPGAGGDIAHESSLGCYERIKSKLN
ncbi:MAG: phytoene desaturase family protein [bacterium]